MYKKKYTTRVLVFLLILSTNPNGAKCDGDLKDLLRRKITVNILGVCLSWSLPSVASGLAVGSGLEGFRCWEDSHRKFDKRTPFWFGLFPTLSLSDPYETSIYHEKVNMWDTATLIWKIFAAFIIAANPETKTNQQ